MSKYTTGSDSGARFYALTLVGVVFGTYVVSALAFNISPQSFYFRAYEFMGEVISRKSPLLSKQTHWEGYEKGNISADYVFHYQDSWGPTTVSMNANKFRNGSLPLPATAVVVGDSFAWGSGLSDDQTFSAQLSRRIGAGVLNATWNERAVAELPPTVTSVFEVFEYGHITPDFLRVSFAAATSPLPPSHAHAHGNFFRDIPVERYYFLAIANRWIKKLAHDWDAGPGQLDQPLANPTMRIGLTDNDADRLVQVFVKRAAHFRQQGRDYTLVMAPRIFTVLATDIDDYSLHYYTRLALKLNAAGVPAIDMLDSFEAHDAKSLYFRTDGHWNAKGVALAVDAVDAALRKRGLVGSAN